jgi:hypothetical protein
MDWTLDISTAVAAAAAVAAAIAAVLSYRTATRALDAARDAVDAANASVVEERRQAQLASAPFVRFERPKLAMDPERLRYLAVKATNLGPGLALEVRMAVERQDQPDGQWYRTMRLGSREPLVEQGADVELHLEARDEANLDADWEEGTRSVGTGVAPARPPLVPVRLRFRFDYLSALGATVTQVHVWETDRLHLPPDPWTWRLEEMTVDPGAGSGEPIVVRRPND